MAGDVSVAFVNSARVRDKNRQLGFKTYPELVQWTLQAELLPPLEAGRLLAEAETRPEDAQTVAERALELREALRQMMEAMLDEQPLPTEPLAHFNQALAEAMAAIRVVPGPTGLAWDWPDEPKHLERVMWPLLFATGQFLTQPEAPDLRRCALPVCGLLFAIPPGVRERRWCETKVCGHRAKALRYYRRNGRAIREQSTWGIGLYHNRRPRGRQKL